MKLNLARKGVTLDIETMKRGIILADRDECAEKHEQKYLRGDEFLPVNPHKKEKIEKTKSRRGARATTKRGGRSKSPSKKKKAKRDDDDDDDL